MNPIDNNQRPIEIRSDTQNPPRLEQKKPTLRERFLKQIGMILTAPLTFPVKVIIRKYTRELDRFYGGLVEETQGDQQQMRHAEKVLDSVVHGKSRLARPIVRHSFTPTNWRNLKSVSMDKNNELSLGSQRIEDMQELIKQQLIKDFPRSVYIDHQIPCQPNGNPLDLIASIREKLFPQSEDRNGVALQIAWIITQGTVADAWGELLRDGTFGLFSIQNNSSVIYSFHVVDNPKSIKIHIESTQRVFPDSESFDKLNYDNLDPQNREHQKILAEMKKNGAFTDVLMQVDLELGIVNNNIDWDHAQGNFSFIEV